MPSGSAAPANARPFSGASTLVRALSAAYPGRGGG